MDQFENPKGLTQRLSLIDLKEIKATKTTDFLLPLLGFTKNFYSPCLINAYMGDVDIRDFDYEKIYICISNLNMDTKHKRIEDTIKKEMELEDYYDVLDGRMTIYVIAMPKEFKEDYKKFLKGKYSEYSDDAKIYVLKGRSEESAIPRIFNKHITIREYWEERIGATIPDGMEVWPKVSIKEELFNKKLFTKN